MATTNVQAFSGDVEVAGGLSITGGLSTSVTPGSYLTGSAYNGSTARTFAVDATTDAQESKIVARDSSGDIFGRYLYGSYLNMSHGSANRNSDTVFYSSGDDFIRKNTASGMRSSLNVPTRTGGDASGTWEIGITGNAGSSTNVRVDRDDTGDTSMYLTMVNNNTAENSKRLYMDTNLVYDNTNNELKLTSMQIADYIYHAGDTNTYFGFNGGDSFRIAEGGTVALQVNTDSTIDIQNYIRHAGDTNTYMGFNANDQIVMRTAGTDRVTVKSDGSVGIGQTNPGATLEVGGTSTTSILKRHSAAGTSTYNAILNGPRPGTTTGGAIHFINGSARTDDGGASTYTIRNDSGPLRLGNVSYNTIIEGNGVTVSRTRNSQVIIEDTGTDAGTYFPSLIVRSPGTSRGTSNTDNVVLLGVAHDGNSGGNNYNRLGWDGGYLDRLYLLRLGGYSDYGTADTTVAYLNGTGSETAINFTGQHRTFIKDTPFVRAEELEGLIVSSDQNKYIKMSGGIEAGSNAITINESLPIVSISTKVKDKKCFGVISSSEDPDSREDTFGIFTSILEKEKGDTRVYINSVGEGAIWVTNINGSLESGDYITTSNVAGYGQKQDSEFLANYTVAKITMDCDFDPVTQPVQIIRKELSNVNYWVKTTYENVSEEEYSNLAEENRQIVDGVYQKITKEESKTEQEGYELEVRQELVNVLDEHGQIQWEDHPTETEKAYKIRYLDADGNITDEANAVHKAAFVGCTYHCG
jgi:hypothetical protein